MNEEYLRALHKSLKVDDDYDTWINAVQGDEEYLRGLHSYIGVDDDYETWYSSVLDKKKEDTESLSTGETEDSPSEIQTIQGSTVLPEPKALDKDIPATEILNPFLNKYFFSDFT